jgi:hypothetical protein
VAKKQDSIKQGKPETVGITIRVDVEKNRILSAMLSLKGMTWSGFMQDCINRFILENFEEAKGLFDISRIEGLSREKPQGKPDENEKPL